MILISFKLISCLQYMQTMHAQINHLQQQQQPSTLLSAAAAAAFDPAVRGECINTLQTSPLVLIVTLQSSPLG
jgi:hypothetical protein